MDSDVASPSTSLSSADTADPTLLAAALALPVASIYAQSGCLSQSVRSLCGPTSAINVLRTLGVAVGPTNVLSGTGVWSCFGMRVAGMTIDQVAAVVRHHGRGARVLRGLDLAALRAELPRLNDPRRRYIVNFHRPPIFGWGGGHHSPIAGYLAGADRALVLDVNRRIGPWLVSPERLHASISTIDPSTGRERGLVVVE